MRILYFELNGADKIHTIVCVSDWSQPKKILTGQQKHPKCQNKDHRLEDNRKLLPTERTETKMLAKVTSE